MSLEIFSVLQSQQMPLPSAPNQQFCGSLQMAPDPYAQAYVPTAAERGGDFRDFDGLLLDPLMATFSNPRGYPFAGGIIPMSRLPGIFA
jgi:hypothetical protein